MTDTELQQKRLIAAAIDIGIAIAIGLVFVVVGIAVGAGTAMAVHSSGSAGAGGVAMFLPRLIGFAGAIISLGYMLGRDMLGGDRSLGKKLQGIRVVTTAGSAITFIDSAKRNAIFAIGAILSLLAATLQLVPCIGDVVSCLIMPFRVLGYLVGLALAIVEIVKITQEPEGIRIGDKFAGTRVVR
jgi:RDD family